MKGSDTQHDKQLFIHLSRTNKKNLITLQTFFFFLDEGNIGEGREIREGEGRWGEESEGKIDEVKEVRGGKRAGI